MNKVLVVGSLNMDMTLRVDKLPKLGESIFANDFYKSFGGKGANQAVSLAKLDIETEMIGKVGNDEEGRLLIENILKNGIKSSIIQEDISTGRAIIVVDNDANNNIIVLPAANSKLLISDIESKKESFEKNDIILLQNEIPKETILYSLELAKKLSKITVFNPAPSNNIFKEDLKNVDYLILNESEFENIFSLSIEEDNFFEKALEIKKESKISNIVLTLGKKGSVVFNEKNEIKKFGVFKVKAIDSTAAGDSFLGAFLSKINEGEKEAIKYASAVSAIVVTRKGAQESIPTREEIEKFLNENNIMEFEC